MGLNKEDPFHVLSIEKINQVCFVSFVIGDRASGIAQSFALSFNTKFQFHYNSISYPFYLFTFQFRPVSITSYKHKNINKLTKPNYYMNTNNYYMDPIRPITLLHESYQLLYGSY
jgi:hypothetical protein